MKILAIETSCDETAMAIINVTEKDKNIKFKILANEVSSQIDIHKEYGGVFPALAKREHIKNLPLVFEKVLRDAKIKEKDIKNKIDAIAVTTGPGLEPALWTGIVFAKELNEKYKIPLIPVNHMEGHVFSIFPTDKKSFTIKNEKNMFPALTLLVSGGHTELVLIKDWQKYKKIGQTKDDAAGEAFDKVARMLSLPYPGGPEISKLAREIRYSKSFKFLGPRTRGTESVPDHKNSNDSLPLIQLPRPMIYTKDYDFSFSGLKTAVLYLIRGLGELNDELKKKIACEFENAVVETLIHKTIKAIKEYKIKTLIVGGGVSANSYLQEQMKKSINELQQNKALPYSVVVHFPNRKLSGDNALMIAIAGYYQYKNKKFVKSSKSLKLKANGNMSL
jgi:N6-L-threonylcarbamoyladenine synthase